VYIIICQYVLIRLYGFNFLPAFYSVKSWSPVLANGTHLIYIQSIPGDPSFFHRTGFGKIINSFLWKNFGMTPILGEDKGEGSSGDSSESFFLIKCQLNRRCFLPPIYTRNIVIPKLIHPRHNSKAMVRRWMS
jgi:hypothetical protein